MPLAFFTAQAHDCCRGTSSITTRCRRLLRKEREEGSGLEKRMVTLESIVEAANTSIVIGETTPLPHREDTDCHHRPRAPVDAEG
nr:hypothetical protein Itr_chr06CG15750 [Ipomoea trifida]